MRRVVSSTLLVTLVIGLSAYWIAWRSDFIRAPGEPLSDRQRVQEKLKADTFQKARELYRPLEMVNRESIGSFDDMIDKVGSLISSDLQPFVNPLERSRSSAALNKLVTDIIGMMYYRWVQPSYEDYAAFMKQAGYGLPSSFAGLNGGHQVVLRSFYRVHLERPLDESRAPYDLIGEMWRGPAKSDRQATRMHAVSIDDDGTEVMFYVDSPTHLTTPILGGPLGEVGWEGANSVTCVRFFQPRTGWPDDLLKRGYSVEMARVGVVLEFEHGERFPFKFDCWFDPQTAAWYVHSVMIGNHEEKFGGVFF